MRRSEYCMTNWPGYDVKPQPMERLQFGKALEFWGMWSYP